MDNVWNEGGQLSDAVRDGGVTLVVGTSGSGKTEATSILAAMAKADGRTTHVVERRNRLAEPDRDGEVDELLYQAVFGAGEGDLVIGREVFESDNVKFPNLVILARKRNVTVAVEMQTAGFRAARDEGCDVLVMRMALSPDLLASALPDLPPKEIKRIIAFRVGEGIMISQEGQRRDVRVEMLDTVAV